MDIGMKEGADGSAPRAGKDIAKVGIPKGRSPFGGVWGSAPPSVTPSATAANPWASNPRLIRVFLPTRSTAPQSMLNAKQAHAMRFARLLMTLQIVTLGY